MASSFNRRSRGGRRSRRPSRNNAKKSRITMLEKRVGHLISSMYEEQHYIDTVFGPSDSSTTASFSLLNGVQMGDTVATRTGATIKLRSLDLNYLIIGNTTVSQIFGRVLIVFDKQPNAAVFAIGDLLGATTPLSVYTVGSRLRFEVVMDSTYALSTAGPFNKSVRKSFILKKQVQYSGTGNAGTIADINTNSLYFIHFSDQAPGLTVPGIQVVARLWFTDN